MGMTIAEKIIAAAAGVDSVKPGDIHTVKLDRLMSNDGTTHLTVDMYNNKLKNPHIADTSKLVFIVDHNVPSDSPKTAASQKKMRDFAKEHNIDFWEGKGVCHQVMIENYVRPGELIFGADSHTCSYGALGAFGTGVGCTDFLYGMVTGTSWVLVPESVKFNLTGKLPEGVYARDLILTIIGEIGANGCNYQAMEFTGEGAKTLSISDRMALCNMAVEAGAKTGIFEADEKAIEYLNTAIAKDSNNPQLYDVMGRVYETGLKDYAKAEEYFKKALAINPDYIESLSNLGRVYYNQGVNKQGEANMINDAKQYQEELGKAKEFFKQALPYFEKAHQMKPEEREYMTALRGIYYNLNMGDKFDAIEAEMNK